MRWQHILHYALKRKMNYNTVVAKYPQYKEDIDLILTADGYTVNDDGTVTLTE